MRFSQANGRWAHVRLHHKGIPRNDKKKKKIDNNYSV